MIKPKIITVTLNPCMDKTVQVARFTAGQTNRALSSRTDVGGKGVNVSRVLCGCGEPFVATGLVAGVYGRKIVDYLESLDVICAFCEAEGETRVNLKILDESTGSMTELNEKGFEAGSSYTDFMEALMLFLPDAEVLVLSGSVPPDIGTSVYRDLTALANSFGVKTILDADGAYLRDGVEAKPYAVKPNLNELETLVGHELTTTAEIVGAAHDLIAQGVKLVCVSMGERGAIIVRDTLVIQAIPFPIEVGSAAAAGDSMVAMLAYATVRGLTLLETARLMTAAGTLTASLPGTQVASFDEIISRQNKVETNLLEE